MNTWKDTGNKGRTLGLLALAGAGALAGDTRAFPLERGPGPYPGGAMVVKGKLSSKAKAKKKQAKLSRRRNRK